ncbi:receptor-like protein kinase FERONIA isoform X2 [Jatropha curcas]|uniref:receptor-like protein kinase FERONIA isoform X2 n=1 Tax=Jatropha curcas TaxID=180498 RepID=UPI001893EC08|nr:receptor-like protein kinase FERONIA isoform X2 [Jatropha curcas]
MKMNAEILTLTGAALGTIVLLFLICFTVFFYCKRKRSSEEHMNPMPEAICRRFTAKEIRNATNNFDRDLLIGEGGFGRIFKGYLDSEKTTPVAIKALKPYSSLVSEQFWAEIEMLSKLCHPHLVSLIGYCNDQRLMVLVYEYMAHGTLRDHLYHSHNPPLPWKQRLEICIAVARVLHYLHAGDSHTIIHRDIKTSNILLDENCVAKVSDFGLSKSVVNIYAVSTDAAVLCARPVTNMQLNKEEVSLIDWARNCIQNGTIHQIIDPKLRGKIFPECLNKYVEIAANCVRRTGIQRLCMDDVIENLEFALELQQTADSEKEKMNPGGEHSYPQVLIHPSLRANIYGWSEFETDNFPSISSDSFSDTISS